MKKMGQMVACVMVLGVAGVLGQQQKSGNQSSPQTQNPGVDPMAPMGLELPSGLRDKQVQAREDARQKQLVADTDKLLALATQLHTDVGRTDKHILSVDVIKRSEEIEKLARSVKEKMRGQG